MATGWEDSDGSAREALHRAMRVALAEGRIEDADAIRAEAYAGDDVEGPHCGYCGQWGHDCNAGDECPMEPIE